MDLNEKKLKKFKSTEGSVLLMSIVILSGIITAASSFAIITMSNLNQAVLIDNSSRAFYAAESGIEDALYEIRKNRTEIEDIALSGVLSNSSIWSRNILNDAQQIIFDIDENDFEYVDLYDPDSSLSALDDPIKSIKLSWTGDGTEWIEVQIISWTKNKGEIQTPTEQIFSAVSNPAIVNLENSNNILYRIRIKAIYSGVEDMVVTVYSGLNASGSQVNIPGFLTIYSNGSFSRAMQSISARMPQREALSGNFGYVLFSEEDLIK